MWTILQLADAAFPSGAFAHSGGLEAVLRLGELEDLDAFVDASLWQAGRMSLPFIGATEPLEALDRILDGMLVSHVANRASLAHANEPCANPSARSLGHPPLGGCQCLNGLQV